MVTSIVLTGKYNIGISEDEKIMIKDEKVLLKDVPFVRYRFSSYSEAEFDYIKKMQEKFKYSAHLMEITISENTQELIDKVLSELPNVIRYVYIPVVEKEGRNDVANLLPSNVVNMISDIDPDSVDRFMLKDLTENLHAAAALNIKKQVIRANKAAMENIGICSSPLSFNGDACLTAVIARRLSAEYSGNDLAALPSANHECMNCCGCIRYHKIDTDVSAPAARVRKSEGVKKKDTSDAKKEKADKKPAKSKCIEFFDF